MVKNSPANSGDAGLIPGSGRSPVGNGNPLQYSSLENPTDKGALWATVHGVTKSLHELACTIHNIRLRVLVFSGTFETQTKRSLLEEDDVNLGLKLFLEQFEQDDVRQQEGKLIDI